MGETQKKQQLLPTINLQMSLFVSQEEIFFPWEVIPWLES